MSTRADKTRSIIAYCILACFLLFTLTPVLSIFTFAFLPEKALKQYPPQLIPDLTYWDNFIFTMTKSNIPQGMLNSVWVVGSSIIGVLVIGSMAAYGTAKASPKFRAFVYAILMVTNMIPAMANMIPLYMILTKTGLLNSYAGLVLIYITGQLPLSMLILIGYFKASIAELEEAAMIDGCNWWQAFVKISLPIAKTGLVTCIIFTFAGTWNEFMMAKLLVTDPSKATFQVTLYAFQENYVKNGKFNYTAAASIIGLLPVLIVYCTFQKGITSGMTAGAIK